MFVKFLWLRAHHDSIPSTELIEFKKKNWTKPDWLGGKVNNTGRVGGAPALPLDGRV